MPPSKRIFTLHEARALLPRVQELTRRAVAQAEELQARLDTLPPGPPRGRLESEYTDVVQGLVEAVVELGCEVKGLWLVDFDSGDGLYYCWHHPEPGLDYFHDYDSGFAGRRPLGPLAPN
jgi:hypothetical protein